MKSLDPIIDLAIKLNATDVHIRPNLPIYFRIDNNLSTLGNDIYDTADFLNQIMAKLPDEDSAYQRKRFESLHDIDCAFSSENKSRLRANIFRSEGGISVSIRILPNKRLSASDIGVPLKVPTICGSKNGIFIVTGPNGSGKSTTLAAMLDIINNNYKKHIITIEDPIENIFKNNKSLVTQREVHRHTPDFHTALRSALRENPDVIMLGEMRDPETTSAAVELAETGHLVLATMHTCNAATTIDRLIGQFESSSQTQIRNVLSEVLIGVLAQTLPVKIGGGRIAAFELLTANFAIKSLIREGKTAQIHNIIQTSQNDGMMTLEDSLIALAAKKVISLNEAVSHAASRRAILNSMKSEPNINKNELAQFL